MKKVKKLKKEICGFVKESVLLQNKIKNLHISLKKKDVKIKNQAKELTSLNFTKDNRLSFLENENAQLKQSSARISHENIQLVINRDKSLNALESVYNGQMKVLDSENKRLSIIIDNYEVKLKITVKD